MIYFLHPGVVFLWIAASWLIGLLGKNKRFGFFGNLGGVVHKRIPQSAVSFARTG